MHPMALLNKSSQAINQTMFKVFHLNQKQTSYSDFKIRYKSYKDEKWALTLS